MTGHRANWHAIAVDLGMTISLGFHLQNLGLTKHHAMKAYWVSEGIAPRIL
jgi:hypothetical protein